MKRFAVPAGPGPPSGGMKQSLSTFARNAIADYSGTAAIAPSSNRLAAKMVRPLSDTPLQVVLEFGPGTGVMTRELLKAMPADGLLLAFEISSRFVEFLAESFSDPRLRVVQAGAETALQELSRLGIERVDGVLSSLGVGIMDESRVDAIFGPLLPRLASGGVVTQFQYVHRARVQGGCVEYFNMNRFMERYFRSVRSEIEWMNLPPAHVITCREPRLSDTMAVS